MPTPTSPQNAHPCTDESSLEGGGGGGSGDDDVRIKVFLDALTPEERHALVRLGEAIQVGASAELIEQCKRDLKTAKEGTSAGGQDFVIDASKRPSLFKRREQKDKVVIDELRKQRRVMESVRLDVFDEIDWAVDTLKKEAEVTRLHMARDSAQRAQEHKTLKGIVSNNNDTGHKTLRLLQVIAQRMNIDPSDVAAAKVDCAADDSKAQKIPMFMGPPGSKAPPKSIDDITPNELPSIVSATSSSDVETKDDEVCDGHSVKPEKLPVMQTQEGFSGNDAATGDATSLPALDDASSDSEDRASKPADLGEKSPKTSCLVAGDVGPEVPKRSMPLGSDSLETESKQVTSGAKPADKSSNADPFVDKKAKPNIPQARKIKDVAMTEAVNKMSKSALRLRQDPSTSSSRSAPNPGPPSVLADTSNKSTKQRSSSGIGAKQRKQLVIQPRENKAAALRAKKNREKVEEQKLKEKMEETRKKKEQQRKEKEIERNVEQKWCSDV